jgi:histidine triad (HIT) family protein
MTTIFSRIIRGESPGEILYHDEVVTAFRDINPLAPIHILIVPNQEIATLNDLKEEDEAVAGRMLLVARKLAVEQGVAEDGYRLILNCNEDGGQSVFHLHLHLLGGRSLGPMVVNLT